MFNLADKGLRKDRLFLPASHWSGIGMFWIKKAAVQANTELGLEAATGPTHVVNNTIAASVLVEGICSAGAGAPAVLREVGSSGNMAPMMAANDRVANLIRIPREWDRSREILVRAVYTTISTTSTDGYDWLFVYDPVTTGIAGPSVAAIPGDALDTIIAEHFPANTTAGRLLKTAPGIMNKDKLIDAAEYLSFSMELNGTDASEEIFLQGVEFEFFMDKIPGQKI